MNIKIYGLPNCDSTQKLLKELKAKEIAYEFVDLRQNPPSAHQVKAWLKTSLGQKLLNKQSTTWRELSGEEKLQADTTALLLQHPTLFKRPIVLKDDLLISVGYPTGNLISA